MSRRAGTITQISRINLQSHGGGYDTFNQLDPSLAPLNGVEFDATITGTRLFSVTNLTPMSLNITATVQMVLRTDAGVTSTHFLMPLSIPGNPITGGGTIGGSESLTSSGSLVLLASPSLTATYVGTSFFAPDGSFTLAMELDVPSTIATVAVDPSAGSFVGTETVTFFFGPTPAPTPEPRGFVMLGVGLLSVAAVGYRSRSSSPKS
jgi:hypothetical protein